MNQPVPDNTVDDTCPVCPHSVGSHDAVALRFCAAIADRGTSRRCVCPAAPTGPSYANSTRNPMSGNPAAGT